MYLTININGAYLKFKSIFQKTHTYSIIAIWERASVSLVMLSAKQGNHWYHFYRLWYDSVLDRELNPGPSERVASTLELSWLSRRYIFGVKRNAHT